MQPFEKTPDAVTGRRISAVDYAKTFAILCVVVIHVSSEVLLGRQIGSAAWLEGLFWSSLARGAVPMFLMSCLWIEAAVCPSGISGTEIFRTSCLRCLYGRLFIK